jgi:hypothetical protein
LETAEGSLAIPAAGEKQGKAADEEALTLLQRFSGNPDVEKARAEFGRRKRLKSDSIRISLSQAGGA